MTESRTNRQGTAEVTGRVVWDERDSRAERPPLDGELTGWNVRRRRRSHLNAIRRHEDREYHLKWFFHRPLGALGSLGSFGGNAARRELESARRLHELGIPTVEPVGWGHHSRGTFFVMEGSPGAPLYALPEPPAAGDLGGLARELGRLVALLHNADLCHRDLYVDHVLIHRGTLRLIDVGRVRRFRRRRWIVKDLAGLLFSAWREGLPAALARCFLGSYLAHSARRWERRRLIARLVRKARRYQRHNR